MTVRSDLVGVATALVLACALYGWTSSRLLPWAAANDDVAFGADSVEVHILLSGGHWRERHEVRHPLFFIVAPPLAALAETLSFKDRARGVHALIVALAALNVAAVTWLLLRRARSGASGAPGAPGAPGTSGASGAGAPDPWLPPLFAGVFALSFAPLVMFSIPETYALSALLATSTFLLASTLPVRASLPRLAAFGVACGLAGMANPPLLVSACLPAFALLARREQKGRAELSALARCALVPILCALVVYFAAVLFMFGTEYFEFSASFGREYLRPRTLVNAPRFAMVLLRLGLFSAVSPLDHVQELYEPEVLRGFFSWSARPLAALLWLVALGTVAFQAYRHPSARQTTLPLALWLAVLVLFHVVFSPKEALLFACQLSAALVALVMDGVVHAQASGWSRPFTRAFSLLLLLALAAANLPALRP